MFTYTYRGMFIHGFLGINTCKVNGYTESGVIIQLGNFRSYRAAQIAITRYLAK